MMQQLGLPVIAQLLANVTISPEKQPQKNTENSDPEYNGEDEADSDGQLSDLDLEPEQELGCTLASLSSKVLVIPYCQILICGMLTHCI
jgi:hypothetical protein